MTPSYTKKRIGIGPLKEAETTSQKIVFLFLDKLEKLTEKERAILIVTIDELNNPLLITHSES
jgi:hypothetical protein